MHARKPLHNARRAPGAVVLGLAILLGGLAALLGSCEQPLSPGLVGPLVFTVEPTTTIAGVPITPAVQVIARDALGNPAPGYTGEITVALGANPAGGTLSGTPTRRAVAGIATFSDLSINKAGTGYTLLASATEIPNGTSAGFSILAGPASALVCTVAPATVVAGMPIAPALQIVARDEFNNTATSFTGDITVTFGTNPNGGTLAGTTTQRAVAGIATFADLSIDKAASGYTLTATAPALGLSCVTSAFSVAPGDVAQLVFAVAPTTTTAGAAFTPAVQVTALDAHDNTATEFTGSVTLAIGTNPGGGTLAGPVTRPAVAGIATFPTLSIDKVGTGYTLQASAGALRATSAGFAVTPGAPTRLVFIVEPTITTAGAPLTPALEVTAHDAFGNTAPAFTGLITIALGTNPGGGTLAGTKTALAVAGVATFPDLSIDKTASGITLTATATGLTAATSAAFTVIAGSASALAFTISPTNAIAGTPITPAIQVTARDAHGNIATEFTGSVTLAIGTNPGGGTLGGPTQVAAVTGVASFSFLNIDKAGTGYTLRATAPGLTDGLSASFTIAPAPASQLVITGQPSTTVAGAPIAPAVHVTARDAHGNIATEFTGSVTLAIGTNPGGGTLTGTATASAVAGVATFSDLRIDKAATGYTLAATATGLADATSPAFTILAGPAAQLVFIVPPTTTTAGAPLTPAVQVAAEDAFGNPVTQFTDAITVAIGTNPGGGTLTGTTTAAAVAGVATFSDLSIDRAATGTTLTATASGLTVATSAAFTVTPGPASQLFFMVPPTNAAAGTPISPAVQVIARDALGNTATGFSGSVTIAIGTNPNGSALSGTTTVVATAGVATFSILNIDQAGTGYTLIATAPGLNDATSASFTVAPAPASELVITGQPGTTMAGAPIAPVVEVTARDAQGNTATGFTGIVTIAIGTNPGGGTLAGTTTASAVDGVATFSDLSIDRAAIGYTLTATATGLAGATSTTFTITPGVPALLVFSVQPNNASAEALLTPAVQVTAQDALGNTTTSYGASITVAIAANPNGGTLSGTTTVTAVSGVATFPNLSIDKAGIGYTLRATSGSLPTGTSAAFNITPSGVSQLAFTVQPSNTLAGATITPAVQVTARDAQGNTATGFTGNITVAIGTNAGGGTLSGTTTVAAVAGVATFSTLSIDKSAAGYTLTATAPGVPGLSNAFDIIPGSATQLVFTQQPTNSGAGLSITPGVQVMARDDLGNTATGFTGNVTVSIGTNPAGGTLAGTPQVAALAGVATFSTLSIDKSGTGYTLLAAAAGLPSAPSTAFAITPGPISGSQSTLVATPTTLTASNGTSAATITVTARDALGNVIAGAPVTFAATGTGNSLNPAATTTSASGEATATFSATGAESKTISATVNGVAITQTATVTVAPAGASQFAFAGQPSSSVAGATIAPAVQVIARDPFNNTVSSFTGNVILSIENDPGGGTLSGTTQVTAVAGVATFSTLSIDRTGSGYILLAAAAGLVGAPSAAFDITPGPVSASQSTLTATPATITASNGASTATITVTARDALGNVIAGAPVTFAATGTGNTLSPAATTTNASGTAAATFSATVAESKTLSATVNGMAVTQTATVTVAPAGASQLVLTGQPSSIVAGAIITPAVEVSARDPFNNPVPSFAGNVTVAIGTNPGAGTLSGTTTVAAVAGVATFSNLSIDKSGVGYTLQATSGTLTAGTSTAFTITPGAATQLVFTVPPTNTTAGSSITPAVQIAALDALGNTATGFAGTVTVAIGTNPSGGTLSGTTAVAAAGVATFSFLSIDKVGTGYTLSASATGVGGATSTSFTVDPGTASQLVFTGQPTTTTAGATINAPVQVTARDAFGNTLTGFSGSVTVAIGTNPGGGTLSGTTQVTAVAGVATFSTLSIDKSGTGYTLLAAATGLVNAPSAAFAITSGPVSASQSTLTATPATVTASNGASTATITVTARDALGNVIAGAPVTFAATGTGNTLSPAVTTTNASGTAAATFSATVAESKTLSATVNGMAVTQTATVTVAPAGASQLVLTGQPSTIVAGAIITPAVEASARDPFNNPVPSFSGNVTVAIATNPGAGTLSGTTTVAAVAGVATFSNLSIDKSGTGYTVTTLASGLTIATSVSFNVTPGTATQLVFTVPPTNAVAGTTITPAVQVAAQDALGNTATSFTGSVTVAIGTNPEGGTLSGTSTQAAVAGIASFANLSINKSGTGYTLEATSGALASGTSAAFTITPGVATQLVFAVEPTTTTAGVAITPAVQVAAQDAQGNTATGFTGNVTVAIGTNPGAGTLSGSTTVAAIGGIATFSALSIDKSGTGYALTAAAPGFTNATSSGFDIIPGTGTQLVFAVEPTNTAAGTTITPAVQVTARDAQGNTATGFTGNVTVAIGTNPGGGTLSGTTTIAAVAGVATFSPLSIDRVGAGYRLTAAATGLTGATSTAFDITPGAAAQLVVAVPPTSSTAGASIAPAVQIMARDAQGNTATGFTGNVTIAIGTNPGAGTLSGTTTVAAVAGIATFSTLSIDRVGTGYTLTAAATGLTGATSTTFTITPGVATQLVFAVEPTTTTAGVAITPAVQVAARDAQGNTATGFTGNVTVAIGSNPGGATLAGTVTVAAAGGVASFADLSINKNGTGYTITAAATGLAGATSTVFDVTPGTATQLVFTVPPSNTTAGATITPAVQVTAQDAQGNIATTFTGNVTFAIGANPGAGTLSGTTTVAAVGGIATFSALSIDKSGIGYTLTAAATGLVSASSAAFDITPGAAAQLVVAVPPTSSTAGASIAPAVQIMARDAQGNTATGFTGNVTIAIGTNPGAGTLSGTTTVAAVAGIATFSTLSIDRVGTGYTLTAAATGLTGATSTTFTITPGAATQLVVTVEPINTTAGATITPAVQVAARDAQGNAATGFTGNVTVAIGTNPSGGALSGTTTVAAAAGVATFSTLSIGKSGTGYTLTATATGLSGATSSAFNIMPGTAVQLVFAVPPTNTTAGASFAPAVQVAAQDGLGNTATGFAGPVTVAIGSNPGGATLAGTVTVAAAGGVASFADLSINKNGTGYTLTAAATGLAGATSTVFDVTPGTATQLVFTVAPSNTTAGATITPAVQITAQDAQGNTATTFTANVTVAIGTNPGAGTLSGTTAVAAVGGIATFSALSIDKSGIGYTLTAAATGLTGATSSAFDMTPGTATHLVFTVPPSNTTAGATIAPAVQVTARDAQGNTAAGFTGDVTVAIGTNPGGGTLSGTTTIPAIGGIAAFSALSIDRSGTGYTFTAAAPGLSGATSGAFDITPGTATQLVFAVPPASSTAGASITPAVQIMARDAQGNTATGFTGDVTVAIGTNPGAGTLSGTTTIAAAAGIATFATLGIDRVGTGYTLTAAATGLSGATSTAFTITAGAATQLVFTEPPTNTTAGATITPAVQVTALDAQGNTATGFTGNVTVVIGTNAGGGTLAGTATVAAASGVASFANLSINKTGTGYTLQATSAALAAGTSAVFDITPGTATQLVFVVPPANATAGAIITPAVQVAAQDALGNTVPSFTGSVTVAIGANPGGGTLSGTTTVAAAAGIATFSTLSMDKSGTGYTLQATTNPLTAATSAAFAITAGAASQIVFTVPPTNTMAGSSITPAVRVTARDVLGNTATGFTGTVTVAIGTNPGGGTLSGTTAVAAAAGVATFATLRIDRTGPGYTLTASANGLGTATSASFDVAPGLASQLVFTVQPTSTTAGAAITPAVQVTARDAEGNTATTFAGNVTIAIGTNPGGGTVSGTTTVAAVAGVATFSTLSIDKSGAGYDLNAAATGFTDATSTAFDITPGAATQLAFTVPPSNATAGASITPAVQVAAQDVLGNTATSFSGSVTVAIGANPGGSTRGPAVRTAVAGVATFSDLSIEKVGTGYTITAAAAGLSGATSTAFDITPGAAAQLIFTVQPTSTTAGATITPAVQVTARDAEGNTATGFTGNVTVAIGANPGGSTRSPAVQAAVAGVATFAALSIEKVGTGYTITAAATGLSVATSTAFDIAPGAATQLVFTAQPTNTTAGATITPAVQVTARDAQGNTATEFTGNVTVAIGANPGGSTRSPAVQAAVAGVATFSDLSIEKVGTGYTITAAATGLAGTTSTTFDITPGAATQLVFTAQPTNTTAGATINAAVEVRVRDALGNTATGFTGSVTIAIGTNPNGGTLSGTTTVPAAAGIATFSTLSIDKVGTGYTLTGATTGLTGATSTSFEITAGAAAQLVFTVQPISATAGASITPAVQVTARDALGNTATGFAANVTVGFGTNPAGGTLSGTTTVAASAGVASFANLSINKSGTGYSLTAAAPGFAAVTSTTFDITPGAATQLFFTILPSSATAGASMTPAVQVTARDGLGNTATAFASNVSVAIGANPGGGTLSGTTTVAPVAGIAAFSTLSIDKVGTGYTLTAVATGVTGTTSASFTVTPGAATQLAFTSPPSNTTAGFPITPAVQVTARDAHGNAATGFTGNVTVAIGTNPGGGTLAGTATVAASAGVASFVNLSINKTGTGYTLAATATGLAATASSTFDITPGAAAQLVFAVQPTNTTAGSSITPAVQVAARDGLGNVATFTGTITVAMGTNPGGGTLSGTTTQAAVAGIAAFSTLSIDKVGVGYTLTASATGLGGAASTGFDVAPGAASQLAFTTHPTNATAGALITPAVRVTVRDAQGNTATGFTGTVTVAIGTNPGAGTLSGTTTVAAVAGIATFANLSINKSGTGYTLQATSGVLTGTTSVAFTITAGAATQLAFTVHPNNTTAGATITPAVRVAAQDALGNTTTTFTGNVTVAIGTNPAGGTLSGTTTVAAAAGIATFSTLSINKSATGYTLQASSGALTTGTSAAFTVTPGAATQLFLTVQPSSATAGASISPAVQVTARDALGNTASGFTGNVTVSIENNPGGGTLAGATQVAAAAGVATFPTLSIDKSGTGYTLLAFAGGLVSATSTGFAITPGPVSASQSTVVAAPTTITASSGSSTATITATARDAFGNVIAGAPVNFAASGTGHTLSPASTTTNGAGAATATFSATVAGSKTVSAIVSGVAVTQTATVTVAPAGVSQLAFTAQPSSSIAAATITPAVQVSARDPFNNLVPSYTGNVTVAIETNPGGGTLSGTKQVAAVAGVATFSTLSINMAGTDYTLLAAAAGLVSASSAAFDITSSTGTQLVFTVQPATTTAGATINSAVEVTARDAMGNTATGFTGNVTIAIGTNPNGGALSGTTTVAAVAGVATFSTLSIDKVGTGYTLTGVASGVTGTTSTTFTITPGPATQLAFTVQPSNTTAGATITPAVQVTARDAQGNTATGFTDDVTVAIGANPGGSTRGPAVLTAVAGVATFSTLSIEKVGTGYTLLAAAGGLVSALSTAFDIMPGTATQLVFTEQPTNTTAGATITPAVQVTARDAEGNTATGFTGNVTVAIGANPGGSTRSPAVQAAVAGVATFSDLSIEKVGTGYTITAAAAELSGATSTAFDITPGAAAQLIFTVQPTSTTAGATITPAVQVTARDAEGNTATGFTGNVTVAIGANPGGSTRSPAVQAAVAGVATFSDLSIETVGTGYTITAAATELSGATSTTFDIATGAATQLIFTVPPSNTVAGVAITPAVEVTARDALGNTATGFTGAVTVVIETKPSDGTLSGTTNVPVEDGVAVFSDLSINMAGSGYSLTASASGLAVTSPLFAILAGPLAVVEVDPASISVEEGRTTQLTATPKDASGNPLPGQPVTWASSDVSVTTVNGSGLVLGFAEGPATVTATSEGINGTSAISVAAPPPCLTQTGPTIPLSGVITSAYSNTGLADNTKVDASTAQFVTSANVPVRVGGGSNTCFRGGEVLGALPPSTDWDPMHDAYAFLADGMPFFLLENVRAFDYGDGVSIAEDVTTPTKWTVRGVYFKYMRDDCIQNDFLNPGTIDDSFFDGCYVGISSRPFTTTQDGSNNVVVVKNSLIRLQDMDEGFNDVPGHGGFFKWDDQAPQVSLHNNIFRVDSPSSVNNHTLAPPAEKLKDCANNVMIWLGAGPFPEPLPSCYTLKIGAEGLEYWNNAVTAWKAGHPKTLSDVGPPIISLVAPVDGATLTGPVTLQATAVDDQDVVGVQFKLDGTSIGLEVASESPLTKFTLSWDSQSMPNGTYTLTATARDAAGNTQPSAGITVMILNPAP